MNRVFAMPVLLTASLAPIVILASCGDGERDEDRAANARTDIASVEQVPTRSWALPTPNSLQDGDLLGHSVAISGDIAVVGVVTLGTGARGAYVYQYRDEEWELWHYLPLEDQGRSAFIPGRGNIEIHGSTIAVRTESDVFVYRSDGKSWVQDALITVAQLGGQQISGLALGEDALAITVRTNDDDFVLRIFSRSVSGWSEGTTLATESKTALWGNALALDGDLLVVGSGLHGQRGSTTVFRYRETEWHKDADLVASDGGDNPRFGMNVAVDEGRIVVGAPEFRNENGERIGAVYEFVFDGSKWVESGKIFPEGDDRSPFGNNLALSDKLLLVGRDRANADKSGAAYVYRRDVSGWELATTILEDPPIADQGFGFDVDLDGHRAVISSWGGTGMQIGAMMGRPNDEPPKPPNHRGATIYNLDAVL
jgi:hypothetical protein